MKKVIFFIQHETVLTVAFVLALISCFFVQPSKAYIGYINFSVLSLLFCLMTTVAGIVSVGAFDVLSHKLLSGIKNFRTMAGLLVLLCFFMSMFLTNDVTLITVVPFTIMLITLTGMQCSNVSLLVFETIAANLGSMLTPFGNPQNLYLYTQFDISMQAFLKIMFPYSFAALILLLINILTMQNQKLEMKIRGNPKISDRKKLFIYIFLFIFAILTVARILDYRILLLITILTIAIMDRRLFLNVDYSLLLTFVFFFVFVGNMGRMKAVSDALQVLISGRALLVSVLASQFISNVPAAILLSGFTQDYRSLIIGTNLGGLGTLIASMASLISYKFYAEEFNDGKGRYIAVFSFWNIIYLVILFLMTYLF
ncbi:MAG: citrate transporter [Butyrivibrio sp.]|nr:citrate transporter [Butyrivibrio sp.]